MKIVIIGGTGFIGQSFIFYLVKQASEIHKIISISRSINVKHLYVAEGVEYHKLEEANLSDLLLNTDILFYFASSTTPSTSWEDPLVDIYHNLIPSLSYLEEAAKCGVGKIVYLSSAGTVYGETKERMSELGQTKPFNPYGITKLSTEHYLDYFSRRYQFEYMILRISNAYGEGLDKEGFGVLNTWLKKIKDNQPIEVFGSLNIKKNFIYIDDLVQIIYQLAILQKQYCNAPINVCDEKSYYLYEVVDIIKEVSNKEVLVHEVPALPGDNSYVELDNSLLVSKCKELKLTTLKEGISKLWCLINP